MKQLKLYKISQTENNNYETYDSAIVCAENKEEAKNTLPGTLAKFGEAYGAWTSCPEMVDVQYIGIADKDIEKGVIVSSFNAG